MSASPSMPQTSETGLTDAEVAARVADGRANTVKTSTSRSVADIVRANVFTLFNGIILAAMAMVLATGSWKDAVFGFVIIINTGIGIVTELKAKRTLDKLSILVAADYIVRRGGRDVTVAHDGIVLDDLLWLRSGDQVPADATVVDTYGLELDESMLTGESRTVRKKPGDTAYSGSTVVSGMALTRVVAVGEHGYAATLTAQAKVYKKTVSDLNKGINTILKFMTFLVVPLCVLLIVSQIDAVGGWNAAVSTGAWRQAVVSAVAGVVGMIPEGLVLLTSLNFAIAAMRLARHDTLVQELESVETLARVDCLNLDKTGTVTDGGIAYGRLEMLDGNGDEHAVKQALYDLANEEQPNGTGQAVLAGLRAEGFAAGTVAARVPFSSARKWSSITDDAGATWIMGAPEVLLSALDGDYASVLARVNALAKDGNRVLMIACATAKDEIVSAPSAGLSREENAGGVFRRGANDSEPYDVGQSPSVIAGRAVSEADWGSVGRDDVASEVAGCTLPQSRPTAVPAPSAEGAEEMMVVNAQARPVALVLCAERIRADAEATLAWFCEQGVRCRIISGDNPVTVGAIAAKVRLTGDRTPVAMDARQLPDDLDELARTLDGVDVLGRVLPDQKKAIVQALHLGGHVVAMTGDGVNDALAIKEADLGIAMGNAAPATKAVAQVVLVDSKFSHLPDVVARGRQVMANMERVASLFLVKTVYSALISLGVVLTGIPFPYLPRHITYIGALTIGAPAFILALAPNTRRYLPGFLRRVVRFALPGGTAIALAVLCSSWILPPVMGWNVADAADLAELRATNAIIVFVLGVLVLARVARPLNSWRGVLVAVFAAAGVIGMLIPFVADFFALEAPSGREVVATGAALLIAAVLFALCHLTAAAGERIISHSKSTRQSRGNMPVL
ncbi:HAD-IC family P-type ATPase [Bifidobacterium aerophilum]|uniref:HAD-IC family P-type ATPase n=1 Tax=Bifidobacterium aerophilum TaxID=1798155 RepID=A0A6N9Z2A7_9BIFI|nr:HAD-IC family P-type ATPase [Bifidobacterium aerophilum]NEG88708.1 HAD-IC family P-type ATPase [Bifidobacterium aerophilum]